ncbi:MAG TPA: hypothetical protein VMM76_10060 [Pirellulaceae bacterium]|nr:hypothetical protein [Pirellulaceae bacterium]
MTARQSVIRDCNAFGAAGGLPYPVKLRRQSIHASLQVRAEFLVTLAVKVLELVEDEDVSEHPASLAATMKLAGTIEATTHNAAHAEQLDALVKSANPSKPQSELNS